MDVFNMLDPVQREVDRLRTRAEDAEGKRDCEGCRDRIGVPCLRAWKCERMKGGRNETGQTL